MTLRHCALVVFLALLLAVDCAAANEPSRPNVLVLITDDQGFGDLGCHGNLVLKTPNLDRLASQSVRLTRFYVSPVCSPTRASLMTGRYNFRTGVVDTFLGRSMMFADEVTLAEMLQGAGYRTGIFGKWHLGDNYPLRAIDQGFQEALVLKGGGIGQPSDPLESSSYFDPVLQHNGRPVRTRGYVSDVLTDAAIEFIQANRQRPFFAYLAFNCPHTPLEVPQEYLDRYKNIAWDSARYPESGHPVPTLTPPQREAAARVYAMVANIDENLGRLFAKLDASGLSQNTLVIFLTDNGPQQLRYNAGLRNRKGSVYDGGIRVPCFVRWPARLKLGAEVDRIAAHIDLAPTILEACGVGRPSGVIFDGKSVLPLLEQKDVEWPDRTLFFQWHRGDRPELHRAFAARSDRYKLLQSEGVGERRPAAPPKFELYDMLADPFEQTNLADRHPEVVAKMQQDYGQWFSEVTGARQFARPRIVVGSEKENPVTLTRQDWRGPGAGWTPKSLGHWVLSVEQAGVYDVTLHFRPQVGGKHVVLELGGKTLRAASDPVAAVHVFGNLALAEGPTTLSAWVDHEKQPTAVWQVEIKRVSG